MARAGGIFKRSEFIGVVAILSMFATYAIYNNFMQYTTMQKAAFQAAIDAAQADEANFSNNEDVIQIQLFNTTGGTERVYLGTNGAKTLSPNGVETLTPPDLIATLPPHGSNLIYLHQWENKYISTVTSYIFLLPVNSPAYVLQSALFRHEQQGFITDVFAVPNQSDNNFTGYPATSNTLTGTTVADEIQKSIDSYTQSRQPDPKNFPTDFWSYVSANSYTLIKTMVRD